MNSYISNQTMQTPTEREIANFDPCSLKSEPRAVLKVIIKDGDTLRRIFYDRPKGDLYFLLAQSIERIIAESTKLNSDEKVQLLEQLICIPIGSAARDLAMPQECLKIVELCFGRRSPEINTHWTSLELYRAVGQYAKAVSLELPEILRDVDRAWACSVMRSVQYLELSPRDSLSEQRKVSSYGAKVLVGRINSFPDSEPEDRALMDVAIEIIQWNEEEWASKTFSANERSHILKLRREVRDKFKSFRRSLTQLASWYKNSGEVVATRRDSQGRLWLVGPRNELIPI